MPLAPVLLFAYKRLDTLEKTINSLQANFLAPESHLFIFSDAGKNEADNQKVEQIRNYLENIEGFKQITIKKAPNNKGLAKSIIEGVTEVLQSYDSCIVLEDDLMTSQNFLNFMNESLVKYQSNEEVFSISGFTFPVKRPPDFTFDAYFNKRGCSWGWATWADRWTTIDWEILDRSGEERNIWQTKILGSDFPSLVRKYRKRTVDSWAIPWSYFQYKKKLLTLYPAVSKVKNIGFGFDATHTLKTEKRFATYLDTSLSKKFLLSDEVIFDKNMSKQYTSKFSYYKRLKWRLAYDFQKLFKIN